MEVAADIAFQLPIEGQIPEGHYRIEIRLENIIGHGWITQNIDGNKFEVPASFLLFENPFTAITVHKNLSRLKGDSFVRSYFVVKALSVEGKSYYWLVVEKIESSLYIYNNANPINWDDRETRLPANYQDIIRDIIRGMCQLDQEGLTHGVLSSRHIVIINNRAKFAFIRTNSPDPTVEFRNMQEMFRQVLGESDDHFELFHFHQSAWVQDWANLRRLYFHPLLMSCGERFLLPIRTHARLRYRVDGIRTQIVRYNAQFGLQLFWKFVVQINQQYEFLLTIRRRLDGGEYHDRSWDQFRFVRNTNVHINENIDDENERRINELVDPILLQTKTEAEVENDLSRMFPDFLNKVYDFFDLYEITPSVRLHIRELEEEFARNVQIQ